MNEIFSQIKAFYEGLDPSRRRILLVAVALSILGLIGVGLWSSQERYGTVYTSADPREVQATTGALEAAGIEYRVSRDGTRLEVPIADIGAARLQAAAAGQFNGLDIIGAIELGTSPSNERMYQNYALQKEIERTVNSIDAVTGSRVHIVQPDRVNFFSRDTVATASVMLDLMPGTTLSREQIAGIAGLVSGAVHGLESSDVSLIDNYGTLLHPSTEGSSGIIATVSERASVEEGAMQGKILQALLPMLGHPRHVAAAVTVELETSAITRNEMAFDPESGVLVSSDLLEEQSSDGAPARGVPGAESNLPEQAAATGGSETSVLQEQSNYEYSQTNTVETLPAGRLKRVSTSVTVDARALQRLIETSDGAEEREALEQKVEELIRGAVGYRADRGDTIEVAFIPFVEPQVEETSDLTAATWHIRQLLPSIIVGLSVLMFFLFVAKPLVAKMIEPTRPRPGEDDYSKETSERESTTDLLERMRGLAAGAEVIDSSELNQLITSHEGPAAAVLRRWIKAT
ncbi:MAG: flagellar basal-body MS-ring/collar protein FliF [Myxococcota bacterium]|nr:flagellar basal-body MS-ring/collar protein FliF [Myxococcota bacterium]